MTPQNSEFTVREWKDDGTGRMVVVSSNGRVFLEVPQWEGNNSKGKKKGYNGYPCVTVGRYNIAVHRLVAECYIPNPNGYPCVGHKDDNKYNCNVSNLEWLTYSKNNLDSHRRRHNQQGLQIKCIESGVIFPNCYAASEWLRGDTSGAEGIRLCARGINKTAYGTHWEVVV